MATPSVREEILLCLPHLRAFARSLAGNRDKADDLVQDAIVLALAAADQFTPGTNFKAWIFTILRNRYFNDLRKNRHIIEPLEAADVSTLATAAHHDAGLIFDEFRQAFMTLAPSQREALILVAASGFSYGEAAKAPAARARRELLRLNGEDAPRSAARPAGRLPPMLSFTASGGAK